MTTGWETLPGSFPWPPRNVQAFSAFKVGSVDLRWDDPSTIMTGDAVALVQATGDMVVTAIPSVEATASGTVSIVGGISPGDVVIVGSIPFTAVAGARTPGQDDFNCTLPTTAAIAADLANSLNDAANSLDGAVLAVAGPAVITLTAGVTGSDGNLISLGTLTPGIAVSGTSLEGGTDASTFTVGGVRTLTAVTGPRTPGGHNFSIAGSTFDVADSMAAAINDVTNGFGSLVTATSQFGKVSLTAVPVGADGNAVSLSTDDPTVLVLSGKYLVGGSGSTACQGVNNTAWTIVGVNIYRSDNGQRGPYVRVNRVPIGSLGYRDQADNTLIEDEVVRWDGDWLSQATDPNNADWIFRAKFTPMVKSEGQAIAANSPSDVILKINGVAVPAQSVFGPTGDVTLINQPTWDLARERWVPPVLPTAVSAVTITYRYNANLVPTDLDRTNQVWYRLTTVAIDTTGTSPSGLVETPLGYCPPVGLAEVETVDYIWREAKRRNLWILEQGGERVKLFKKKVSGLPCPCYLDPQTREYGQQPSARCTTCFGTGFVGGFDGPTDIILAPDDAERRVSQTPNGRRLEHTYEVWTTENPSITQRDFIVKQTGERYSIGPVRRPAIRGLPLQQHFNIQYLDEQDIRYTVPVTGTDNLPWPETRYTNPELSACVEADPFPVGFDYQATPMGTEVPKIPDGRQIRGRTPIWANTTYGGKGGGG